MGLVSSPTTSPLLAERRRATWLAIHRCAFAAVVEGGAEITVASIAEAAGVSPRTFFNYFASKEDAILGLKEPRLRDTALAGFLTNPEALPPLHRLAVLIADVAATTTDPEVDLDARRTLAAEHPDFHHRLLRAFHDSRALVIRRLIDDADTPWLGAQGLDHTRDQALALLQLAAAAVIYAFWQAPNAVPRGDRARLDTAIASFTAVARESL